MAMSGITVAPATMETYSNDLKIKRSTKFLILEIKNDKVVVKSKGPANATVDDFIKALDSEKDFCYGVFSGEQKIGFLIYGPPTADFKKRMVYASTSPSKH